ncbi:MAG: LacI family DNA-binding transcriptional regulator [Acidimicrobiales bacterium]
MNGRRPTIIDVAAAAGVSKSAVSLALRGDEGVSEATRERIRAVADSLGYRSNAVARALVQGRTGQIGVVVTDLRNPYHTDVALGVEAAAAEAGMQVLIAHGHREPDRLAEHLDAMISLNVEGVVIVSSRVDPDLVASCGARLPLVVVGRPAVVPAGVDHVANDDAHGATTAVDHLAALGHRAIAFLSGSDRPAAMARRDGYAAAMARWELDPPRMWVAPSRASLGRAIDELLRSDATAVLTNNDITAIAVLDRAHDLEVDVPGRLSVIGYDDTALAATVRPRLTSVDQLTAALGATAMTMLGERIDGRTTDRAEVLEPVLRIRESTASPT